MRLLQTKGGGRLSASMDSLEDDAWFGVEALVDFVVGGEGQDPGAAAGPHRAAVQRVRRLAQTHNRCAGQAHLQGLNRPPVLLLRTKKKQ